MIKLLEGTDIHGNKVSYKLSPRQADIICKLYAGQQLTRIPIRPDSRKPDSFFLNHKRIGAVPVQKLIAAKILHRNFSETLVLPEWVTLCIDSLKAAK